MCLSDIEENKYPTRTSRISKPSAIISITCTDQGITRYYTSLRDCLVIETTEDHFESLKPTFLAVWNVAVVCIRVKSIKVFLLNLNVHKKYIKTNL